MSGILAWPAAFYIGTSCLIIGVKQEKKSRSGTSPFSQQHMMFTPKVAKVRNSNFAQSSLTPRYVMKASSSHSLPLQTCIIMIVIGI